MRHAWMAAYPWDLLGEGLEASLDRLRGEVGVTGIALHILSGPQFYFRALGRTPCILRTQGGACFTPEESRYAATRCRAPASDVAGAKYALEKIASACSERKMPLRVAISATRMGNLAQKHPEFATKNAFGAASTQTLCLNNPDVQALVFGLVADVGDRPGVESLLIEDFGIRWFDVDDPQFVRPIPVPPEFSKLIGICFCESCRQLSLAAGVDAGIAARMVCESIDTALTHGESPVPLRPGIHKPLKDYLAWQATGLRALRERIKRVSPCPVCWLADGEQEQTTAQRIVEDAILRIHSRESLTAVVSMATPLPEISLSPKLFAEISTQELVGGLVAAAEHGMDRVQFEHYGVLSESVLIAIRQALRFARRTGL